MIPPRAVPAVAVTIVAIAGVACGDNTAADPVFAPASGSRIALQWYRYEDGTEQPAADELYDRQLHARCRPVRWIDDVVRCVPVGDDAVYIDAACESLVGRGLTIARPTHFIGYDRVGARELPARAYQAGAETTPAAQFYERRDGACVGPFSNPDAIAYFELAGEIAGAELVALRDGEVGAGRLALRVRETDDGLRGPVGVRDRELEVDCTPTLQPDGGVRCEPTGAAPADLFRDPACGEPVIVVAEAAPVPTIARVVDPSGCASYHGVGGEVSPPLYRRDGLACVQTAVPPGQRLFTVEAPVELSALGLTVEAVADRRLQRIILSDPSDGELYFAHDLLLDAATRAECRRHAFDDVTRCIPAAVAIATALFTASCAVEVRVAEVPERSCVRLAFATATTAVGIDIHAIGDRVAGTLYHFDGALCQPYPGSPGTELRALGPPIDPQAFMAAVYFGER